MALSPSNFSPSSSSLWFLNSTKQSSSKIIIQIQSKPTSKSNPLTTIAGKHRRIIPKATQESTNKNSSSSTSEAEKQVPRNETEDIDGSSGDGGDVSKLGAEIQKAMKERAEKEEGLLSGVAEEIREIEWPAFNKVLGTTVVVLGVIAGSSVVLLTVNAILAELSDRIFAGKGVQDFFS